MTSSAANINAHYAALIDKVALVLEATDIRVFSAVPNAEDAGDDFSWPAMGSEPLLVLYETAEDAVARGLSTGVVPSQSLEKWISGAEVLLAGYRQRRRQLTFVSIGAALTDPDAFLTALSRRFETYDFSSDCQMKPSNPAWFSWQGLLARQIASSNPTAMRLNDELEAAALPLASYNYDPDGAASEIGTLLAEQKQLSAQVEKVKSQASVELAEAQARQSEFEVERALFRDQIIHLQQVVQDHAAAATETQRELSTVKLALSTAQERLESAQKEKTETDRLRSLQDEAKTRQSEMETERTLLRDQIVHMQQALQEYADAASVKEREFASMKLALTAAQDRVEGLEATLKGLTTQLARERTELDALTAGRQQLLMEFSRLMDQILNGRRMMKWPKTLRRAQQIRIVRECGIVDPQWYLHYHTDVAQAGAEPFRHYIDYGVKEGRPPNAGFA